MRNRTTHEASDTFPTSVPARMKYGHALLRRQLSPFVDRAGDEC